jgi:hypothetical protein
MRVLEVQQAAEIGWHPLRAVSQSSEVRMQIAPMKWKSLRADAPVNIQPPETCPHDRVYTWFVREIANDPKSRKLACHGCCDCGTGWTTEAPRC